MRRLKLGTASRAFLVSVVLGAGAAVAVPADAATVRWNMFVSAHDCEVTSGSGGSRSKYRLANSSASSMTVSCPIQEPLVVSTGTTWSVLVDRFMVTGYDASDSRAVTSQTCTTPLTATSGGCSASNTLSSSANRGTFQANVTQGWPWFYGQSTAPVLEVTLPTGTYDGSNSAVQVIQLQVDFVDGSPF